MPANSGGGLAMRAGMMLQAFATIGSVDLVVLPVCGSQNESSAYCEEFGIRPKVVPVDGREKTHFTLVARVANQAERLEAFKSFGEPSLAAYLSVPVLAEVAREVAGRSYDLVHISRSYLLPVLSIFDNAKPRPFVSVDLDEDDVLASERIAALFSLREQPHRAEWQVAEGLGYARLIRDWLPRVDLATIATEVDRTSVAQRFAIEPLLVPNAVDLQDRALAADNAAHILFVGSFDHFPNVDAVLWLCEEIWPDFVRRSKAAMTIIGRAPPPRVRYLCDAREIEILTSVTDLHPYYARASLALVPIRAGAGSRYKLLEAAAHSVPVVATRLGAEGLEMADGRDLWLADDAYGFAEACADAIADPRERLRRAEAARQCVKAKYNRSAVVRDLQHMLIDRMATFGA